MPLARLLRIYRACIIIIGLAILFFLAFVISFDRESFINFVTQRLQRPYLSVILHDKIITPRKFILIRDFSLFLVPVDILIIFLLYRKPVQGAQSINFIFQSVKQAFGSVSRVFTASSKKENIIFLVFIGIVIARGIYYIIITDLQYDEMWCYNYYTSRPFYLNFFSFSTYPLYELITHAFKWLPFSAKVNLRLPSLVAGLSTIMVIYTYVKRRSGHFLIAIAAVALFAAMPFNSFFMIYGKGVMVELFFAVSSFFCVLQLLGRTVDKKYLFLFVLANVGGMYSMVTHSYFMVVQLAGVLAYIRLYKKDLLRPFLTAHLFVLFFSILCYLPVFIGSGFSFILDVSFGQTNGKDPWSGIVPFMKYINLFFTGSEYGFAIALFITGALMWLVGKNKKDHVFLFGFAILLFILPVLIRVFQNIYIAERAIPFMGLIFPICAVLLFLRIKDLVNNYVLSAIILGLFTAMCGVTHFHYFRSWNTHADKNAIQIADLLMEHHVQNCYDNAPASGFFYYYPALEFYFHQKKLPIDLYMAAQHSLRYRQFSPQDHYDCIVDSLSANNLNYAPDYEKVYADAEGGFEILIRKGK